MLFIVFSGAANYPKFPREAIVAVAIFVVLPDGGNQGNFIDGIDSIEIDLNPLPDPFVLLRQRAETDGSYPTAKVEVGEVIQFGFGLIPELFELFQRELVEVLRENIRADIVV